MSNTAFCKKKKKKKKKKVAEYLTNIWTLIAEIQFCMFLPMAY